MRLIPHHQDDRHRREYRSPDGTWRVVRTRRPGGNRNERPRWEVHEHCHAAFERRRDGGRPRETRQDRALGPVPRAAPAGPPWSLPASFVEYYTRREPMAITRLKFERFTAFRQLAFIPSPGSSRMKRGALPHRGTLLVSSVNFPVGAAPIGQELCRREEKGAPASLRSWRESC